MGWHGIQTVVTRHPNCGGSASACTLPVTPSLFTEDTSWDPCAPVSSIQFHNGALEMTQSTKRLPSNWEKLSSYLQIHTKPAQAPHPNTPPGRQKAEAREFPEAHGLAVKETLSQSKMTRRDPHGMSCVLQVCTWDEGSLCSATHKHGLTHKMPQHLNLPYTVPPVCLSHLWVTSADYVINRLVPCSYYCALRNMEGGLEG